MVAEPVASDSDPIVAEPELPDPGADAAVDPVAVAEPVPHGIVWPATLEDIVLQQRPGRLGGSSNCHPRLAVSCNCGCGATRSRSIELCTAELGDKAPLCFLGAWLEAKARLTPAAHKAFKPSLADMGDYKHRKLD